MNLNIKHHRLSMLKEKRELVATSYFLPPDGETHHLKNSLKKDLKSDQASRTNFQFIGYAEDRGTC